MIQAISSNDSTLSSIPVPVDIYVGVTPQESTVFDGESFPRLVVDDEAILSELNNSGQDIYRFWAVVDQALTIELEDVSLDADLRLAILADPENTQNPLAETDDSPAGIGELVFSWNPPGYRMVLSPGGGNFFGRIAGLL